MGYSRKRIGVGGISGGEVEVYPPIIPSDNVCWFGRATMGGENVPGKEAFEDNK